MECTGVYFKLTPVTMINYSKWLFTSSLWKYLVQLLMVGHLHLGLLSEILFGFLPNRSMAVHSYNLLSIYNLVIYFKLTTCYPFLYRASFPIIFLHLYFLTYLGCRSYAELNVLRLILRLR